jgi:hypothetical protein
MARKYKQPSIVSGMSIQDILNMDNKMFNSLNTSDLRKVVGRLVSAGNKRLRSFERAGESSPATRHVAKSGGVFSTKGKDLNALRSEYTRAKNFLQSKTGTRKGWKQVKNETISGLKKQGVEMTEQQFNDVWKAYEDLKELSPEVANRGLKYSVLKDVADMVNDTNKSSDEIATALHENLSSIYEEQAGLENGIDGVSGFFEIE